MEDIETAHQMVEQATNIISTNHTTSANEISFYFYSLTRYYYIIKNYSEAFLFANLHLNSLHSEDAPLRKAKAFYNLSLIRTMIDEDLELARMYNNKALEIYREENHYAGICNVLSQLAVQYHRNQLYEESLEVLQQLSDFTENYKKDDYAPILEYNYGRVYQKLKQYDQAIEHYYKAIGIDTKTGNEEDTIHALKSLAEINIELKNWDEANKYLERAFTLAKLYNDPNVHIQLLHLRAQIYKVRLDYSTYEKELQNAVQLAKEGKYPLLIKEISTELADHYNSLRAYKMAAKYYQIAIKDTA